MLLSLPAQSEGPKKCESGGVVIQSNSVKKSWGPHVKQFSWCSFCRREGGLGDEALDYNSSSFPVPQTAPPVAKPGTIGRSRVQLIGFPPSPSFGGDTEVEVSQPPVTVLTLVRLVRIPAGLGPQPWLWVDAGGNPVRNLFVTFNTSAWMSPFRGGWAW